MLKKDIDELQTGDWCFQATTGPDGLSREDAYIGLRLHEGDWGLAILPIALRWREDETPREATGYFNVHGQKCWKWNGSKESPTLTPSILHWGNGKKKPATWHGYLTDGKLVTV